jgi:hypothetical protein
VNLIFFSRKWLLTYLIIATALFNFPSLASEYEVDGNVSQNITNYNGSILHASASFTVFVRDCDWLIETMETNEIGIVCHREVGATNGADIYECEQPMGKAQASATTNGTSSLRTLPNASSRAGFGFAVMIPGNVPVGETDSAVVGHLWLMFASRCYWQDLHTDQLRPVYDWHASVAAKGQDRKVKAEWDLLNGAGSLPQEVRYLGEWGQTNVLYRITGSKSVGGMLIPTGFAFQRFQIGPLNENTFVHEMVVNKRVDVTVTDIRPTCSRASLIPTPEGRSVVVDRRFDSGIPNRPPSYQNPVSGQWPTMDKSKELANVAKTNDLRNLAKAKLLQEQKKNGTPHYRPIVLIIMFLSLIVPPVVYLFLHKSQKH